MGANMKPINFPGFAAVSDQVFVREGVAGTEGEGNKQHPDPSHPTTIAIYSWGDAIPKHVTKYADGYRALFPGSRQVVILAPIFKAVSLDLQARVEGMKPAVEALFPSSKKSSSAENAASISEERILIHAMSNTGGINYASTLTAYRDLHAKPMPHHLLVLDSAPGIPYLNLASLGRWSHAMALGTAAWFPWPFTVTQGIWAAFICISRGYETIVGRVPASIYSTKAVCDKSLEVPSARRLYLYGTADPIVLPQEVEHFIAESVALGWKTDAELFEGTGHCGHMRTFPKQYWAAIEASWTKRVGEKGNL